MDKKKKSQWNPEGFPQPRTFPKGWDGNALTSTNGHNPGEGEEVSHKDDASQVVWNPEKFPKPRTYPKNWSIDD